jgi:CDP-6-deoxy-D-xylo-4-hexulose-3-dehydrase
MATFNNEEDYIYAKSLRGWGRRSSQYGETEDYNRRFDCKIAGYDYDDKYVFDDLGYNFMPSEVSAAFALVQLSNLENNLHGRASNFKILTDAFSQSENFSMFSAYDNVFTGWLAFPMLLTNKLKGKRKEFQIYLEKAGIQTRTIFTGNILKQPVAKKFAWDSFGDFEVSDEIMQNGIMLGCHNQMDSKKMAYMQDMVFEAEAAIA